MSLGRRSLLLGLLAACLNTPAIKAAHAAPARRVVAIGGRVTEIVFALGAQSMLVARDSTSVHPPEALALPDIGYMRAVSPEGVLAAEPDLILATIGSGPPEAIDILRKSSVRVVDVPQDFNTESLIRSVELIGVELDRRSEAEALNKAIKVEFDALELKVKGQSTQRKRVLFILSINDGQYNVSGLNTAASAMISYAGADNLFSEFEGYKTVGSEAILTANPDAIVLISRHGSDAVITLQSLSADPLIGQTEAVKAGAIITMPGDYLLGFGPRTPKAAMDLHAALFG
ncbi:MAG: ABC transporter substrate-binding protein [Sphingopyxis sp.]|nr:ABC transporter substrate-binding protein [Sphingopyxis sp.]